MKRVLLAVLIFFLLVSCSSPRESRTISVALAQEPVTLDIMTNSSVSARVIASGNIYEKLLVEDSEGRIREELCSKYELSDNNRTLTFTIREGVRFHDGSVMTAEDVCSSMNRYLSLYSRAGEITDGALFEVVDERTIRITSENSLLFLPDLIASSPQEAIVMPSYLIEGTKLVTSVIGTGPYRLSSWNPGEKIEIEKFDEYSEYGSASSGRWGDKRAVNEGITYYFVPDSVTRLLGLESGQYDFINDVMSSDFQRISSSDNLCLLCGDESGSIALVFNKKEGPFTSAGMRRAVSYALSSSSLMASCYGESGYNTSSEYMESSQKMWQSGSVNPYEKQNASAALSLLEGEDAAAIRILTSNLSNLDKIAPVIKAELEEVGLKCEILTLDWASFMEKRKDPSSWDIYISAFQSVPLPGMKSYFSPSFPGWMEEESDACRILESILSASSADEAVKIWRNGQKTLWDYAPVYIAGHYTTSYASSSKLDNIIIQDGFYFWHTMKSEKER